MHTSKKGVLNECMEKLIYMHECEHVLGSLCYSCYEKCMDAIRIALERVLVLANFNCGIREYGKS